MSAGPMHVSSTDRHVDVFIAGAGPAGLACAIAAASQGFHVEVADGRKPPIDKACGEGLMPDTLAALAQLGIDLNHASHQETLQSASCPLRGIRFIGDPSNTRHATTTEAVFPTDQGRGVRRTILHQLLLDRAFGLRQHFAIAPWTDFVEVYWTDHAQAYVTPVSPDEICVAFIASEKFINTEHALALFPSLQRHLASASRSDTPRGAITMSRRLRRVTSGNIALIGDASGSVDAITGEGLALCFRQALALAQALKAEDLALYERAHAKLHRLPHFMSRTMLLMDRSPTVLTKALTTLQRKPDIFSHLLQVHIGHSPVRLMGSSGILASLLCFLT